MNRTPSSKSAEIEARLHRSLTRQVKARKLDRTFDAAVWAAIDAQERPATRGARPEATASEAARWLFASNVAGVIVSVLLVAYFSLRLLNGASVSIDLPEVSPSQTAALARFIEWGSALIVFAIGILLTPYGRRLRNILSSW